MKIKSPEKTSYALSAEEVLYPLDHLPVASLRDLIRAEISSHHNFVLVGETGSGKTTCLPPLLLENIERQNLPQKIAVTQPRRVATRSVSARVAEMYGQSVGEKVGYHVRFEDNTSSDTGITYMTDGILLRKIQYDPLLLEYSTVMVDEAHERSLNIDLCLGLLLSVNELRSRSGVKPLQIVITSATIDSGRFAEYIGHDDPHNSIEIPGKMYPVEVFYEAEIPHDFNYTIAAAEKVKQIVTGNLPGDILIFMPGKREIGLTILEIQAKIDPNSVAIFPLHSELKPEDQDVIFLPNRKRKIIVATNIAETSVTIDGVRHVIDSGLIKQNQFNPHSGIEQLVLCEHALSGIEQRKGRAGRTAPGYCYRLYTQESLRNRPRYPIPEIQRSNLDQVVLIMKKVGIQDVSHFRFLDPPRADYLRQALSSLTTIGALDQKGQLTEIGEVLLDLALEPKLGRMILEAARPELNCVNEICIISALIQGKNIFVYPETLEDQRKADGLHRQFKKNADSDFITLLNIWNAYVESGYSDEWAVKHYFNEKALEEAKNVRLDLLGVLDSYGIYVDPNAKPVINKDALGQAITAGLIGNLLISTGKFTFKKVDGTKEDIFIHPDSLLYSQTLPHNSFILPGEIFTNSQGKTFASKCLRVKPEWLPRDLVKQFKNGGHRRLSDRDHRKKNGSGRYH